MKSYTSEWRSPLVNETQHDGKRAEFQPERRIVTDFDRTVVDVTHAARRFRTIDGINSDDNQIAARHFGEQRSDGGVSRKSAVPIWLAINLYGAKELRQARRSQQSIDREVLVSEDAPSRYGRWLRTR